MENASKALIIAGAILLAILIIGLGMFIYQQAANVMGNVGLDTQEIQAFNSNFTQYEGTITGSKAIALCETVRNHNLAEQNDETRQVDLVYIDKGGNYKIKEDITEREHNAADLVSNVSTVRSKIKQGYTYKVEFSFDKASGRICEIGITNINK